MKREFQALCRATTRNNGISPVGEPFTVRHICDGGDQFAAMLKAGGLFVMPESIVEIRAVVDWDKPVWDLDEFAAAMSIKGGTLSAKKGDGKIPWSSAVNGVPRRVAMKWIEDNLNQAGKAIVQQLEVAA